MVDEEADDSKTARAEQHEAKRADKPVNVEEREKVQASEDDNDTTAASSRPVTVTWLDNDGVSHSQRFDQVVIATHAPDALRLLGDQATEEEKELLGKFGYQENEVVV